MGQHLFDAVEAVKQVTSPLLILIASQDELDRHQEDTCLEEEVMGEALNEKGYDE